jgi:hypothetical protein
MIYSSAYPIERQKIAKIKILLVEILSNGISKIFKKLRAAKYNGEIKNKAF